MPDQVAVFRTEAEQAAESLAAQAVAIGAAASEPIPETDFDPGASEDDDEAELEPLEDDDAARVAA